MKHELEHELELELERLEWLEEIAKEERSEAIKEYFQEVLILHVTEELAKIMERKNVSQKDLAERMECSPANVSRLMSGSRNMTLRTLSDMALALGVTDIKVEIGLRSAQESSSRGGETLEVGEEPISLPHQGYTYVFHNVNTEDKSRESNFDAFDRDEESCFALAS